MSSALVIRIIGGVCGGAIGTYISGKIYDYIYNKPPLSPPQLEPPKNFETKIKHAKSFQEILNIQIQEHIDNGNKYNYEYDNEHGNTIQIKNSEVEKEVKLVNDDLYDKSYEDYFTLISSLAR